MFKFKEYDFKQYNYLILIIVLILGSIGAYMIRLVQTDTENLFGKHIFGLVVGITGAIILSLIDFHFICKFYVVLYLINLILLIMVKLFGVNINYAQRWLDLKFFNLQPSELSKIILIIFLAKFFTIFKHRINTFFVLTMTVVLMAIPTFLILTQTDLSTSMVIMFIIVMMLFAAGLSWRIILPVLIVGIPSFLGLFWYIQQDYQGLLSRTQQERVLSILNPELYPKIMYQQSNSMQAIGSGQLFGKLFLENTSEVRGYKYVPINESDFIFSVAGEELGFIGSCMILLLFAILIYKCLRIAKKAPDYTGMLIAVGIASMFMFQVFVNVGVATAVLPNTGIPLPFLSSGLSSLMSGMMAIGIILNIRLQQKKVRGY